jgi:hypothetical protein
VVRKAHRRKNDYCDDPAVVVADHEGALWALWIGILTEVVLLWLVCGMETRLVSWIQINVGESEIRWIGYCREPTLTEPPMAPR